MEIAIEELQVPVRIGCTEEERAFPQILVFDLLLALNDGKSIESDMLSDTIDYMTIIEHVQTIANARDFHLLEHLAGVIGKDLLERHEKLESVAIAIKKHVSPLTKSVSFTTELYRS